MFERLLGQMLNGGLGKKSGSLMKGLGSMTGGLGGGLSKATVGVGLVGVAMAAWEHFQTQQKGKGQGVVSPFPASSGSALPPPPPPGNAPGTAHMLGAPGLTNLPSDTEREADATFLIRAMIAAAAADGTIDSDERSRILERAMSAELPPAAHKFLLEELKRPASLSDILAGARPSLKREIYAASRMAIDADSEAEQRYLSELQQGLALSADEVKQITQALGL